MHENLYASSGTIRSKKIACRKLSFQQATFLHQQQWNYFPVVNIDQPQIRQLQGWTDR